MTTYQWIVGVVVGCSFCPFVLTTATTSTLEQEDVVSTDQNSSLDNTSFVGFQCPDHGNQPHPQTKAWNDFDGYWTTYKEHNEANLNDLANFRERNYDYRWVTYNEMKNSTFQWKRDYFGTALKSGDLLYESACGQGLNLFQTIETLKECCNIENLTISGNDYLPESIAVAKRIYQQERAPWFRIGPFCQGDSTNLSFVPDNTFDLAYTGSIDPVLDPLNIMDDSPTIDEKQAIIVELCNQANADDPDPEIVQVTEEMQRLQEDWHASWVSELLRITKPGHYVIIEDVGWPACSMITEWGGVDPEWWSDIAVERYGWDIMELEVVVDQVQYMWNHNRYNVRMRKSYPTLLTGEL